MEVIRARERETKSAKHEVSEWQLWDYTQKRKRSMDFGSTIQSLDFLLLGVRVLGHWKFFCFSG